MAVTPPPGDDPNKLDLKELITARTVPAPAPAPSPFGDIRTIGVILGTIAALMSGYLSTIKSGDAARSADNAEEAAKYVTQEKGTLFREMMEAMKRTQDEGIRKYEAHEKRLESLEKWKEAQEHKSK